MKMRSLVMAACLAMAFAVPSFADSGVQGVAPGGTHYTLKINKNGALIGRGNDNNDFSVQFSLTDTTVTNFKAAPGASVRACLDYIDVQGVAATTAVTLTVKRASTTLFVLNVPAAASDRQYILPRPVCGNANEAVTATLSGSPTGAVQVNALGFTVPN
jgi:hypothetical protein